MNSTTTNAGRPSVGSLQKKRSLTSATIGKPRTLSTEELRFTLKRDSSSTFNYQTLNGSSSPPRKTKRRTIGRSHSSNNAELSQHLERFQKPNDNQQLCLITTDLVVVQTEDHAKVEPTEPTRQKVIVQRDSWDRKIEFLLAVIGYAVDLGNVWRFPTTVYMNGGGAFFIPYFILLIFGGLPLFYMELALGQYHRSGVFTIWKNLCPLVKGIGWATVLINFMTAMFYNTIISWAVYYLIASFKGITGDLPWKRCNNSWNSKCCIAADARMYQNNKNSTNNTFSSIGINCSRWIYSTEEYFHNNLQDSDKANGFDNLGEIKWGLALSLLVVFVIVYFALWKGIKSSGKAVWITAIAPYAVLFILLIRGVTLEGSSKGIEFYLKPNMTALTEFPIWEAAAAQIFFSLGPGFGVLLALSSYNKFHNNCYRDALVTSTINCATSVLAGFVVFSTLGHMALVSGKTVKDVIDNQGTELVFIVYPHTIALMNWSTLWAVLFFFMIITLGIDSTFGGLESIITGLCDEFPNAFGRRRPLFVLGVLIVCYLGALPTCTSGGDYIVSLMNEVSVAPALLLVVFIECIAVSWFYGVNRFSSDIKSMIGTRPSLFWRSVWYLISPIFLLIIFASSMKTFLSGENIIKGIKLSKLPMRVQVWSFLMVFMPILCIPAYAAYKIWITPGKDFDERIQRTVQPEESPNDSIESNINPIGKEQCAADV